MNSFFSVFTLLFVGTVAFRIHHPSTKPHRNVNPICRLPYSNGTGDEPSVQVYYDMHVNRCVEFVYFGTGGNKNRFDTKKECNAACKIYKTTTTQKSTTSHITESPIQPSTVQAETTQSPTSEQPKTSPTSESHFTTCNLPLPPARNWPPNSKTAYAFDSKQKQCFYVYYDEETLNANNFPSREACQAYCGDASPTEKVPDSAVCALPPPPTKEWPKNSTVGFWYDDKSDRCEPIYYDEETKNGNCFLSVDECLKTCSPRSNPSTLPPIVPTTPDHPSPDSPSTTKSQGQDDIIPPFPTSNTTGHSKEERDRICSLPAPPNRDWTDHELTGYHYDSETEECDLVYYDDKTKNENLFGSLDECLDFCLPPSATTETSDPSATPTTKAATASTPTNPNTQNTATAAPDTPLTTSTTVEPTTTKPAKLSRQEILKLPQCALQPFFKGHCKAYIVSYFFNITTMQCQRFVYGGCGATVNHYNSESACERSCVYKSVLHPVKPQKPLHNDHCQISQFDQKCSKRPHHGYVYNPVSNTCQFKLLQRCSRPLALHPTKLACHKMCFKQPKTHPNNRKPLIIGPQHPHLHTAGH